MSQRSQIRTVLFGLGKMGKNHLRVMAAHPSFQPVAVVDANPAVSSSGIQGIPLVRTLAELDPKSFDAAVVATPTGTHLDVTKPILTMGKPVLVEKPLASDVASCETLQALARSKGVALAVGHVERFNPAVRKLQQVIKQGWVGKAIHINMTRVGGYPQTMLEGNNVLLDLAVHDLDLARMLFGPMRLVSSICHASLRPDVVDTAEIVLMSKEGVSVTLEVNWITPTKIRSVRVTGTRAVCMVDYILQTCQLFGGNLLNQHQDVGEFDFHRIRELYENTDRIELGVAKEEPLKVEYDHFARLLAGEPNELCLAEDASRVVALAQEALRSHEASKSEADPWY